LIETVIILGLSHTTTLKVMYRQFYYITRHKTQELWHTRITECVLCKSNDPRCDWLQNSLTDTLLVSSR